LTLINSGNTVIKFLQILNFAILKGKLLSVCQIADYIRIDIPVPGGSEGRSYYGVQIVMIDMDSTMIR